MSARFLFFYKEGFWMEKEMKQESRLGTAPIKKLMLVDVPDRWNADAYRRGADVSARFQKEIRESCLIRSDR